MLSHVSVIMESIASATATVSTTTSTIASTTTSIASSITSKVPPPISANATTVGLAPVVPGSIGSAAAPVPIPAPTSQQMNATVPKAGPPSLPTASPVIPGTPVTGNATKTGFDRVVGAIIGLISLAVGVYLV